jgi:hypothetical protein
LSWRLDRDRLAGCGRKPPLRASLEWPNSVPFGHQSVFVVANPQHLAQKITAADSLIFAMRHGFVRSYIPFVMISLMTANDGRTS